ncbi:ABC transporter permease [Fervidicella metallireducens]|uniref:ABC transporter permease n=1 Tax=Fervidicella metallireducens TaxID=655338 RepID=UPI000687EE21|nr:FtsX-like permease family protein [Fervidicella metallireducens]
MALNKRIKRVIMRNKAQYIGSILLVMFSCLLFVIYNVSLRGVRANEERFIENSVLEDAKLILQKPIDDISVLESRFNVLIEDGKTFDYNLNRDVTVRVFSNNKKVNIPYITEGEGIVSNQDIIIDPAFAKAQNIKIGDKLKIYDMEFKVTGFFALPDYMYAIKSETDLISDPKAFGIAVISKESAEKIGKGYNFYNIKYNSEKSADIKEYLSENNGILYWQNKEENTRFTIVDGKLNAAIDMGIKLPIIIIVLTCLLLAVVIWRMIKSEFIQIGTLYALGYKKSEILKHYIMYPIIIALTGGIIGTLLGVVSLKPILEYMLIYFNVPTMGRIYDIYYIVTSPIIPLIFLVPTVIFVTLKALKLTPVRLMRGYSSNVKVGKIERKLKLNRFKFKTKYRIREITRNVPRTIVMVLGVTLASMFLLFGFMEQNSMDYIINKGIKGTFKYEYNYILKKMEINNVYGGEEYNLSPFMIKDREINFAIYGLKPEGELINLENKNGEKLKVDRTIISKALAESIGVKPGETLVVTNKYNNKNYEVKIDEVAELYTTMAIYMPLMNSMRC